MSKLKYLLLGAALAAAFFYNPPKEQYYDKVLEDKVGMGNTILADLKYKVIEEVYEYNNYYIFGSLSDKKDGEVIYYGVAGLVFKL